MHDEVPEFLREMPVMLAAGRGATTATDVHASPDPGDDGAIWPRAGTCTSPFRPWDGRTVTSSSGCSTKPHRCRVDRYSHRRGGRGSTGNRWMGRSRLSVP